MKKINGKSKYIYVSGPITVGGPVKNTRTAIDIAEQILKLGHVPYVPHLNLLWEICYPKKDETYLEMDFKWVKKCDYVYRIKGFSKGADLECALAKKLNIPIVYSLKQLSKLGHT
jgi:hypothetical protein